MDSFHVQSMYLSVQLLYIMKQNKNKYHSQLTFSRMNYLLPIITQILDLNDLGTEENE